MHIKQKEKKREFKFFRLKNIMAKSSRENIQQTSSCKSQDPRAPPLWHTLKSSEVHVKS